MSLEISTQRPGTYLSKNLRKIHLNSFIPFTCPIYSIPFGPFGSFHDMILLKLVNHSWSKVQTKTKSEIELAFTPNMHIFQASSLIHLNESMSILSQIHRRG